MHQWGKTVWESDLELGLAPAAPRCRHPRDHEPRRHPAAAAHAGWARGGGQRRDRGRQRDELPGLVLLRPRQGQRDPDGVLPRPRAGAAQRDGRVAVARLAALGGDARCLRRDRGDVARRDEGAAALRHLGDAALRRPRRRRPGERPRGRPLERPDPVQRPARPDLRLHRRRRQSPDAWRYVVEVQDRDLPPTSPATAERTWPQPTGRHTGQIRPRRRPDCELAATPPSSQGRGGQTRRTTPAPPPSRASSPPRVPPRCAASAERRWWSWTTKVVVHGRRRGRPCERCETADGVPSEGTSSARHLPCGAEASDGRDGGFDALLRRRVDPRAGFGGVQVAGDPAATVGKLRLHRLDPGADLHGVHAARPERAARRRVQRVGDVAGEHDALAGCAARPGWAPAPPTAATRCTGGPGSVYTRSVGPSSTMRPRYITATRSAIQRTTERSWVMNR